MKRANFGVYVNAKTKGIEIDIPELLEAVGLPDTEENRNQATDAALNALKEEFPEAQPQVTK
jgi:hypothetical protein